MRIDNLIKELQAEKEKGHTEIFVKRAGFTYNFDIGIDDHDKPILCLLKFPQPQVPTEAEVDVRLKEENLGITDSWR